MTVRNRAMWSRPWLAPLVLLVLGLLIRCVFAVSDASQRTEGEADNVAIAFARTGTLADSYRPGQGLTAHVAPIMPVVAGTVYRALGEHSRESNILLSVLASLFVMVSFAAAYGAFGLLGTPRLMRLAALAVLALAPVNRSLEIKTFRVWDGALAVALGMVGLYLLLRLERRADPGRASIMGISLLAALAFFLSPPVGLALYFCCLLVMLQWPAARWPGTVAMAALALALFVVPWSLRNARVLGEAVPLRSNFGLELALANHPAAAGPGDERTVFRARLDEIHPFQAQAAFDRMQAAGGELAYARQLGDEARAWIIEHPVDFARLSARHAVQYFFPPQWLWNIYGTTNGAFLRALIQWAVAGLGLAGAALVLARDRHRYRLALIMLLVPALPYVVTQPVLRYHYLCFAILMMFGADLLARMWFMVRPAAPGPATAGTAAS